MQLARSLSWVLLATVASCAEDGRPIVSASPPERPGLAVSPSAAPSSSGPAPTDGAPLSRLAGAVVDEAGEPILGRPVVVVDARGKRVSLLTDEGGTFVVSDLAAPYDVSVAGMPSGARGVPMVWLGLTKPAARFVLVERALPSAPPAAVTVTVEATLPPCEAARCWVSVATASATGRGGAARSYGPGDARIRLAMEHVFSTSGGPIPGERLSAYVLAADEGYSAYAFGSALDLPVDELAPDVPLEIVAEPVSSTGPVTLSVSGGDVPAGWRWTMATSITFPDGATIPLQYVDGPALVTRLPRLGAAGFAAGAWAQSPSTVSGGFRQENVFAWSGRVSIGAPSVALDLPSRAELSRPRIEGTLSRRGPGLAWSAAAPVVSALTLTDLVRDKPWLRLFTAGGEVTLGRLARLGVEAPELGEHLVELTTRPGLLVDDLVDPNAGPVGIEIEGATGGTSAHVQGTFMVIP